MAAFEAAISVKSLPVMPRRTSLSARESLASFHRQNQDGAGSHFCCGMMEIGMMEMEIRWMEKAIVLESFDEIRCLD